MKQYIGTDIIEIARIEKSITDFGERFLRRIYTDAELALCQNKVESLSARFAAKEAVVKALPDNSGIGWKDIEVLAEQNGKPYVNLYNRAKKQARNIGISGFAISISHSREYAIAFIIGENM